MLGPRSRSEIDFLEKKKKSEKVANAIKAPPMFSYMRDMLHSKIRLVQKNFNLDPVSVGVFEDKQL